MDAPQPPHLTRRDCVVLFTYRAVVHAIAFGVISGAIFLTAQAYFGVTKLEILRELRMAVSYWLVQLPFLALMGLSNGDMTWRYLYEPSPLILRIYKWVRWGVPVVAIAALFLHWSLSLFCVLYGAIVEITIYRWSQVYHLRRKPDRIAPVAAAMFAIGFEAFIIQWLARAPGEEIVFVFQQLSAVFCLAIFSMFNDINYVYHLYAAGRFPPQGNPHFQVSLATTMKITLAVATWVAIAVWWFKRIYG